MAPKLQQPRMQFQPRGKGLAIQGRAGTAALASGNPLLKSE